MYVCYTPSVVFSRISNLYKKYMSDEIKVDAPVDASAAPVVAAEPVVAEAPVETVVAAPEEAPVAAPAPEVTA